MDSWEYAIADQFMQGIPAATIAEAMDKSTLEIAEVLQSTKVREYMDKIRAMKKMELEALADGPALDVMRDAVTEGKEKDALVAADKIWKASGKYDEQSGTVATLAEILKRIMDDNPK